MSEAKVAFTLKDVELSIQCSTWDKMKDICQKYATKIGTNINSLIFLYGGNQLNFNLNFKDQANILDKISKEMHVLVYKNENHVFICPECGTHIKFDTKIVHDLILSNKNIKDSLMELKTQLDIVISKNSTINPINIQLKNINIILDKLNEDIQKNSSKLQNLLNDLGENIAIKNYEKLFNKEIIESADFEEIEEENKSSIVVESFDNNYNNNQNEKNENDENQNQNGGNSNNIEKKEELNDEFDLGEFEDILIGD